MKLSNGNKFLISLCVVLAVLSIRDSLTRTKTIQPTPLLQRIADRGVPMCGDAVKRYRLEDVHERPFVELSDADREALPSSGELEAILGNIPEGNRIAVVYVGRYASSRSPELFGRPLFLLFYRAGGEEICLGAMAVVRSPSIDTLIERYEDRN